MKCSDEDIEFANLILVDRKNLDAAEVEEWMRDPEHVKLLKEFAAAYQSRFRMDFEREKEKEYARLMRTIRVGKTRRMIYRSSVAACMILLIGVCVYWTAGRQHLKEHQLLSPSRCMPGEAKVELILANGESVLLGKDNRQVESDIEAGIYHDSLQELSYAGAVVKHPVGAEEVFNTLKVPVAGFYRLELADGTKVWLNSVSELRYPVTFTGVERRVYLSGEAFFEVEHDSLHPFVVEMEGMNIRVYGTVFNVCTHNKGVIQTTLVSGKVGIEIPVTGEEVVLRPNDMAEFSGSDASVRVKQVDTFVYTAWKDGKFVFEEESVEEIMERLSRWYGIEVFFKNEEVKHQIFSGVITRLTDVKDVLHLIEGTATVEFEIKGNTVIVK